MSGTDKNLNCVLNDNGSHQCWTSNDPKQRINTRIKLESFSSTLSFSFLILYKRVAHHYPETKIPKSDFLEVKISNANFPNDILQET